MENIKHIPPGYEYIIIDRYGDHEHIEIMRNTNVNPQLFDIRVATGAETDVSNFADRLRQSLEEERIKHVKKEGPDNTGNKTE